MDGIFELNGMGFMFDYIMIVWMNEFGKGNLYMFDNIFFLLFGGGMGFKMGCFFLFDWLFYNCLFMLFVYGMGY